ncbi:tyrosine-type recombinase/integrase [Actinomycetospora flava]|uniref:Tyrosine-type recombinase/integrase n=1 Tax=Actinomycetospora flava TaxID=3129232 RepID=A0ABU8MGB1_9PSEU
MDHFSVDEVYCEDVYGGDVPWVSPGPRAGVALVDAGTELLARFAGEQPALARLGEHDPWVALLAAGWLAGFRSVRTRRAYAGDLAAFTAWCAARGLGVLAARRVQVDLHVTGLLDAGAAASSVARRLSALSSFYRFCLAQDEHTALGSGVGGRVGAGLGVAGDPTVGVRRPAVDADHTATVGLSADQARALITAADTDPGPQRLRSAALVRLLLHTALRVDEALAADVTDLGAAPGRERTHHTLGVVRKGGRRAVVVLAPDTTAALEAHLERRAALAGVPRERLAGPLLATRTGGRLCQKDVWVLIRRLAHAGGISSWSTLSPHSLRHTAITLALDAGASLRDVQDYAGHRDPRTTRRYDHTRAALDRNAAYAVVSRLDAAAR